MLIYNYDKTTREYLSCQKAEADPEATRKQGKFIPLMPACSTLIEPPAYNSENSIPVFENGEWVVKPDYRKNFYKVDDNLFVDDIKTIGLQEGFYIVDKQIGDAIKQNPDKFKIEAGQVIQKSDEEYGEFKKEQEAERIAMLNLTAADVERAIYRAKGIDFEDVIKKLEKLNSLNVEELDSDTNSSTSQPITPSTSIDIKALKIELKANNFYRGNPYIDAVGTLLGFTKKQLDEFFETNDYTKLM